MTADAKHIVVILGAYPDVGKGILTASCGYILQQQGFEVLPLKFDGYLNYNSGLMNPYHRMMDVLYDDEEVFVLKTGLQTDADSGYYERFLGLELSTEHNLTNGQLFARVLADEQAGKYSPGEILKFKHLRDIAIQWATSHTNQAVVVLLEIGGAVGDPESVILYEALRSMRHQPNVKLVVILLSPYFEPVTNGYLVKSSRTKLTRQAFDRAERLGLRPDMVALRCTDRANVSTNDQNYIASDCNIHPCNILFVPDCSPVYELPKMLFQQNLHQYLMECLVMVHREMEFRLVSLT